MNNMAIRKKMTRLLIGILMVFNVFLGFLVEADASSANLTPKIIPSTSTIVSAGQAIPLYYSTDSSKFELEGTNGYTAAVKKNGDYYCLCIKKTATIKKAPVGSTGAIHWTASNPMQVKFKKVGVINGRDIDVTVNFTKVYATNHYRYDSTKEPAKQEDANWIALGKITQGGVLCISTTFADGYGYRANKETTLKTTVTYSDTGATVKLPFFQAVRDIDVTGNYYVESWTAGSDYQDTFYKYSTSKNKITGRKVYATDSIGNTQGNNEILQAGGYILTNNGAFTQTYVDGNCSTGMYLYSQYSSKSTFDPPTKSVNRDKARPSDDLTYEVDQKIGTMYKTVMSPYNKMEFTDTIPKEVTYKDGSAKLYSVSGNTETDISSNATITYDKSTRLLNCTMKTGSGSWINNTDNYDGRKLRLKYDVKINAFTGDEEKVVNTADVAISGGSQDEVKNTTNEAITVVPQWKTSDPTDNIQLRVTIKKSDIASEHGKPTFIFKITGDSSKKEYFKSVTFGDEEASKEWTFEEDKSKGTITATSQKYHWTYINENGYEDTESYKVEPIDVERFNLTAHDTINPNSDKDDKIYPFTADKATWQYYSHNDIKMNRFSDANK